MQKLPSILLGFGLLFLIGAIVVGWVVFPKAVENKITQQVRLAEGSVTWDKWRNITTPIFIRYYLFNVTNPNEVLKGNKPELVEIGPYVYEQKRLKTIEKVDEENDTVTYRQAVTYFFRPHLSEGLSEDDVFTMLNIPLMGFTTALTAFKPKINEFVEKNDERVFIERSVSEILFKGYFQQSIKDLSDFAGRVILPNNTFGIYYGKNGTLGNEFTVRRGVESSEHFGEIVEWNGFRELNWWGGQYCNMINGSDGSIFPPFVTTDRQLRIFSEELCRSLYLEYQGPVEHNGIPGLRFALPKRLLARAEENEDNVCFCEHIGPRAAGEAPVEEVLKKEAEWDAEFDELEEQLGTKEEEPKEEVKVEVTEEEKPSLGEDCKAGGRILLKACRDGKPLAASTPHFLFGEPEDAEMAGLHPVEAKHGTYIDLEPNTGLVLEASKKIQVNILLSPTTSVRGLKTVPKMIFPVLWADEFASMTADKAEEFKEKLLSTLKVADITRWSVLVVSGLLIIAALAIFILRARKTKNIPKFSS